MWKQSAAKRRKAAAMDLFDYMRANTMKKESPLASRMRPTTLDEVVGQKHIIGKDKLLYRAIKADKLGSVIFYGPPGTGKTQTLANIALKHMEKGERVLMLSYSNVSVDGALLRTARMAKDKMKPGIFVRYGYPK